MKKFIIYTILTLGALGTLVYANEGAPIPVCQPGHCHMGGDGNCHPGLVASTIVADHACKAK